jgi:glutamate formiminotransferase
MGERISRMAKTKVSSQLEETDTQKCMDDMSEHAFHLLNDHQLPVELVAGTMMAIAQRLYKTQLNADQYEAMMEVVKDAEVRPYDISKVRLQ